MGAAALITLVLSSAARAQARLDFSSREAAMRSREALRTELGPARTAQLQSDIDLLVRELGCPANPEHPDIHRTMQRSDSLAALLNGKTAAEVHALAARARAAVDAERASLRELPPDSAEARSIRAAIERYFSAAPTQSDSYAPYFPFWTATRVAEANAVDSYRKSLTLEGPFGELFRDAPTEPGAKDPLATPHRREFTAMMLYEDGWLKRLQVTSIRSNSAKAYVQVGVPEKTGLMVLLLERGTWKMHADPFGYPWTQEGWPAVECVGLAAKTN